MQTPTITTPRLTLRPLTTADARAVYDGWASDPDTMRYMTAGRHSSLDDTAAYLKTEEAKHKSGKHYYFGFVRNDNGALAGAGGFSFSDYHAGFELSYLLNKDNRGRGYATEACGAVLGYAANTLHLCEMYAKHAAENPASGKILTKLGFVHYKDSTFISSDGTRVFPRREYRLALRKWSPPPC
ncbi:hypothetical protein FACS1894133_0540 [Clostridia bacterium]|nr:hypothetical protein FACS1894133_0250 [Clostridia bacterium]GHU57525.1 hypothetical protein FACS1894133_0540 [Clostridia bacterium]